MLAPEAPRHFMHGVRPTATLEQIPDTDRIQQANALALRTGQFERLSVKRAVLNAIEAPPKMIPNVGHAPRLD